MTLGEKRLEDYVQMGRYVIYICIFAEFTILAHVMSQVYMMFAGASARVSSCSKQTFSSELESKEICSLYTEINCTQPVFEYQFKSVNVEWDYFCDSSTIVKNSISVQMLGVLVGSVVFGQLSDSFGRKITMILSLIGMVVGWLVVAQSRNLVQFTITRTIVGFFTGAGISVMNVYVLENIPKKHRMWINMAITCQDWKTLAYVNAVICIPPILFAVFFIHESPRWLLTKGRLEETREVIRKQLKASNQLNMMDSQFEEVLMTEYSISQQMNAKKRQYSFYHLGSTWKLLLTTTVLSFSFFSTSVINYGIMFNMEKLSGSIYWNLVWSGLMRYVCNLSFGWADLKFKRIGRKFIHTSGLVLILVSLSLVVFAYAFNLNHELKEEIRIAVLIASAMTSQVYISTGIAGNELFPTPVRNLGYSCLQLWNRVGVVASPFVFYLQNYWIAIPYCVMLVLSSIDMVAFECLLPETKGKPMVEHMPPKEQRIFRSRQSQLPLVDSRTDTTLKDGESTFE